MNAKAVEVCMSSCMLSAEIGDANWLGCQKVQCVLTPLILLIVKNKYEILNSICKIVFLTCGNIT